MKQITSIEANSRADVRRNSLKLNPYVYGRMVLCTRVRLYLQSKPRPDIYSVNRYSLIGAKCCSSVRRASVGIAIVTFAEINQ